MERSIGRPEKHKINSTKATEISLTCLKLQQKHGTTLPKKFQSFYIFFNSLNIIKTK